MRPELVIFDCDGVLVDTERVSTVVLSEMLGQEGYPVTPQECVQRYLGRPGREYFPEIEAELGRRLSAGFVERFDRRVIDTFLAAPRVVDGVIEAIDAIASAGLRRCVASSSEHAYLRQVLGATGLVERFERVFSAAEVARGKPAPDVFLHAASSLGVAPRRCLVVEDSVAGVQAAVAAGIPVFGFADLHPAAVLERAGARVFRSMRELPELVFQAG